MVWSKLTLRYRAYCKTVKSYETVCSHSHGVYQPVAPHN